MRERDALGILFSNMYDDTLGKLTEHRAMGSVPFGGRYRLIDFALSNLVNAGISDVGVVTKQNYQSLMDHLGSGKAWDLSRKRGGLCILPPFGDSSSKVYHSRIEALDTISGYLQRSNAKYAILCDCNLVANIDLGFVLNQHIASGAELSLLYQRQMLTGPRRKAAVTLELGTDGRIEGLACAPLVDGIYPLYLNILVVQKDLLLRLVSHCVTHGLSDFTQDLLGESCRRLRVQGVEFSGTCIKIDSLQSYFTETLHLLEEPLRDGLFCKERPIYTKIRDEVPVRYGLSSRISNSMVADGCIIEGEVRDSVLFRGVQVGKGAVVQNSILMQGTFVGEHAALDHVVTDKNVFISPKRKLSGCDTYPFYIVKAARI